MAQSFLQNTWVTADASPPLVALVHIGLDVPGDGADHPVALADGRVKIEFTHAGNAGRLWIGVGQPAQANRGNYLDPGDTWIEWTNEDIHVLLAGTAGAQRIVGMEWAAGGAS